MTVKNGFKWILTQKRSWAYFGPHKVMNAYLFNGRFEPTTQKSSQDHFEVGRRPSAYKQWDMKSRSDSLATSFARFYSLWLHFLGIPGKVCVSEASSTYKKLKKKIGQRIQTVDENTLKSVYTNNENRPCFLLRGGGSHFKQLPNWKEFPSTINEGQHWTTDINKNFENYSFQARRFSINTLYFIQHDSVGICSADYYLNKQSVI